MGMFHQLLHLPLDFDPRSKLGAGTYTFRRADTKTDVQYKLFVKWEILVYFCGPTKLSLLENYVTIQTKPPRKLWGSTCMQIAAF